MPEFIGGLPLHPLVVHFVVVLLPLAVLGAVLSALVPWVRRRFGWLTVVIAGVATVLVPVATTSGDDLATRFPENELITRHEELGDLLIWWALGLTVAIAALMVVHSRSRVAAGAGSEQEPEKKAPEIVLVVLAVVTVAVAVGTGVHVYRVGDAGARAVWEGIQDVPVQGG